MLTSIIAFIIVIAVCVIVHEYGHYITARILGVQVHEFAFGMGPAILQHKAKNNMLWSLRVFVESVPNRGLLPSRRHE